MSIPMNAQCYLCHLKRNTEAARAAAGDAVATAFARDLMQLYLDAPEEKGSPWFGMDVAALLEKHCGLTEDRFKAEKDMSNRFVMQRLEDIRRRIRSAEDPLYAAMQMAVLGNYIDFSALKDEVSFEKLDEMLEKAGEIQLDPDNYAKLCRDLEAGKTLLYVTDNAGEIGFDRLLAEEIARKYPNMQITFCVRGGPASNDATREDAEAVGIPFPVIDNGCAVGGTELELLPKDTLQIFENADVILSKGQANVETLYGCGWNIYYLFLVKCARFETFFNKPKFTPMLLRER